MDTKHRGGGHRSGRRARVIGLAVGALVVMSTVAVGAPGSADAAAPTGPAEASARWLQVDAGYLHTCGITTAHRLYCWGFDGGQQLGNGGGRRNRTTPVEVAGGRTDWAQVSAGYDQTCAVTSGHRLFCWGTDSDGLLGNGPGRQDASTPVEVAGQTTDWAQVSAGGVTCAVKTSGRAFCWGTNHFGALGNGGGNTPAESPFEVAGNATDWQEIDVGLSQACARKTTGRLFCWGDDTFGQLGNGEPRMFRTSPAEVAGNATNWAEITVFEYHACATTTSQRLFCWGNGVDWALGSPGQDWAHLSSPTEVVGASTNWSTAAIGVHHACGRRTNGRLQCWGSPRRAALGQVRRFVQATPLLVPGGFTDWSTVTAGLSNTCALRANGLVYCWGNNEFGQAGVGSTARKITGPTRVALSA